jgi:parallel beta-helix repeat protein
MDQRSGSSRGFLPNFKYLYNYNVRWRDLAVKRVGLVLVLAFLLLFTVFSVWNVALVKGAEATIYIRDDGSVEGETTKIETYDNVTYTFTDNINGSILVERNNIIIDGAGYTLRGEGGLNEVGIRLSRITNVTVRNAQIVNFNVGVYIYDYSSNNTVIGNTLTDNDFAIELDVSSYNTISENILADNDNGIWLDSVIGDDSGSNYNNINGNNITTSSTTAIGLANYCHNNSISGNNMVDNPYYDIEISSGCSNNSISGNNMDSGVYGISLESQCNQNSLIGNNIRNADAGLYIYDASNNSISGNNVVDNDYGIYFYQASDNKFWHNNFDNTQQVYFNGGSYANIWDDGYPSGGNYWSDYSGSDADGDGIGDSPYTIDGNNVDNYPLMVKYGSPVEQSFNVTVGETDYVIMTVSNSTVSDLNFDQASKQLSFNVSGPSGTTGFCNITVPAELMSGDFTLYLDDVALVEGVDYTQSYNGAHYLFSVTYVHSSHVIELVSTEVVPDFAAWLFLPFLMVATLLGFALRKRMKKFKRV